MSSHLAMQGRPCILCGTHNSYWIAVVPVSMCTVPSSPQLHSRRDTFFILKDFHASMLTQFSSVRTREEEAENKDRSEQTWTPLRDSFEQVHTNHAGANSLSTH